MWTCEVCGREFKNKNQSHSCKKANTIDEYIAQFSPNDQIKLKELRATINKTGPEAEEKISWGMPTFVQNGNLVHFAMHKHHIGFYVGATAVEHFKSELSKYHCHKGTIQLPVDQPLPYKLIEAIVQFKVEKNSK